jgi:hypothetical protein
MNTMDSVLSPLLALMAEWASVAARLAQAERRRTSHDKRSSRRAVLVIELRLKLEEQVLLPVFRGLHLPSVAAVDSQIEMLRDLMAEAIHGELALPNNRQLWAAIERMCVLHFDAVAGLTLLALRSGKFDEANATRQAQDCQARWRDEITQTDEIEDEEAGPVDHLRR